MKTNELMLFMCRATSFLIKKKTQRIKTVVTKNGVYSLFEYNWAMNVYNKKEICIRRRNILPNLKSFPHSYSAQHKHTIDIRFVACPWDISTANHHYHACSVLQLGIGVGFKSDLVQCSTEST
jgi:hypothetical protein